MVTRVKTIATGLAQGAALAAVIGGLFASYGAFLTGAPSPVRAAALYSVLGSFASNYLAAGILLAFRRSPQDFARPASVAMGLASTSAGSSLLLLRYAF